MFQNRTIICLGLLLILFQGCGASRYVTTEVKTITNYVDSLVIRDSTIYHTQTLVQSYSIVPDTLHLVGLHSQASAYLDTSIVAIKGELREYPWKEKIIYKDRLIEKVDSVYVEVPKEIEIVKTKAPKILWISLALNALFLLILALKVYLKLK